jgi:hypothetical protein
MSSNDTDLLEVIRELRRVYPDWRFGQMVCNIATWARGPVANAAWDVEDAEFIRAAREHLQRQS